MVDTGPAILEVLKASLRERVPWDAMVVYFRRGQTLSSVNFDELPKGGTNGPLHGSVSIPYWRPICCVLIAAVLPWLRWRSSLRTLLIAVTLVALASGTIIVLSRL